MHRSAPRAQNRHNDSKNFVALTPYCAIGEGAFFG
jgi:hypothetical protein